MEIGTTRNVTKTTKVTRRTKMGFKKVQIAAAMDCSRGLTSDTVNLGTLVKAILPTKSADSELSKCLVDSTSVEPIEVLQYVDKFVTLRFVVSIINAHSVDGGSERHTYTASSGEAVYKAAVRGILSVKNLRDVPGDTPFVGTRLSIDKPAEMEVCRSIGDEHHMIFSFKDGKINKPSVDIVVRTEK